MPRKQSTSAPAAKSSSSSAQPQQRNHPHPPQKLSHPRKVENYQQHNTKSSKKKTASISTATAGAAANDDDTAFFPRTHSEKNYFEDVEPLMEDFLVEVDDDDDDEEEMPLMVESPRRCRDVDDDDEYEHHLRSPVVAGRQAKNNSNSSVAAAAAGTTLSSSASTGSAKKSHHPHHVILTARKRGGTKTFAERATAILTASVWELIGALILRVVTKKRFWLVVLALALWTASRHEQEIRDAFPNVVPAGMTVEEEGRPGLTFDLSKSKIQRPVVIVPGFITTGLELWEGKKCINSDFATNFRQRMFSPTMLLVLLRDPECFMQHMGLDPDTGGDVEGIRVRHDIGFDAVDYFQPSYWVWAKVIKSLSDIFYDPSSLVVAPYDWRFSPELAEMRSSYFTRLKHKVQAMYEKSEKTSRPAHKFPQQAEAQAEAAANKNKKNAKNDDDDDENEEERLLRSKYITQQGKQKVVLIAHSYGSTMTLAFLEWAEKKEPGWTDRYVHTFISIGGTMLGIPKANAALISGEFKDTATLPSVSRRILDSHVHRRMRANIFRTWPCLSAMITRGPEKAFSSAMAQWVANGTNLTMLGSVALIEKIAEYSNNTRLVREIRRTKHVREKARELPRAPGMTVVCIYGVSIETEVGYFLKDPAEERKNVTTTTTAVAGSSNNASSSSSSSTTTTTTSSVIDWESVELEYSGAEGPVRYGDGDGTVPLTSLGYACRSKKQFPSKVGRVVTMELKHEPEPIDPRGGVRTGDHVDIMGNYQMINTILRAASGLDDEIQDNIVSNIDELTEEIDRE